MQLDSGCRDDWWKGAVIYQIYPRSFVDSNDDGIGDLAGITSRLDYVASLGVDAIWLSPFFESPMRDFGYDISNYRNVDPIFGSLASFAELVTRAKKLGLKVIIDQVLSHTSIDHDWFAESRSDRDNEKSDWYVWADAKADGTPPNNWLSMFGGPAWTWDSRRNQYYLHNFLDSQPDLNFHNPEVREAQLENMRFWLELGVDGFRLDVVNFYFHSSTLNDNPAVPKGSSKMNAMPAGNPYSYQQHVFDISQPENLQYLKDLRSLLNEYPQTTSVGEIADADPIAVMAEYTSGNDKLHMAYTFELLSERQGADWIRSVIRDTEGKIKDGWPCWAVSNHDVARVASRWGHDSNPERYAKVVLAMMLSLRGSSCIYQGDELGFPQADVPFEKIQDPYGIPLWPSYKGRDGCRTPIAWDTSAEGGFSSVEGWLPVSDRHKERSVEVQSADAKSVLNVMRQFMAWRRDQPALWEGNIEIIENTGDVLCWIRRCPRQSMLVAFNLTSEPQNAPCEFENIVVHSESGFSGTLEHGRIVLEPMQAIFASIDP